jgi:hypothetical protein
MAGISDRNHIFHPSFPDIQFNFGSFVNKMLKIKDHWTINIVDYILEIIRSLDQRINSLYRNFSGIAFLKSVSIFGAFTLFGRLSNCSSFGHKLNPLHMVC